MFINTAALGADAMAIRGGANEKQTEHHLLKDFLKNKADEESLPFSSRSLGSGIVAKATEHENVQPNEHRTLYEIAVDTLVYNCSGGLAPNDCCGGELGCVFYSKDDLQNATLTYAYDMINAITVYKNIKCWDVSRITDMSNLFSSDMWWYSDWGSPIGFFDNWVKGKFNEDISCWNTTSVTNMDYMFSGAEVFNQPLAKWDMSSIKSLTHMFDGAIYFNQDLCSWYDKIVSTDSTPIIGHLFDGNIRCPNIADPDFATKSSFCATCPPTPAISIDTAPPSPAPVTTATPAPSTSTEIKFSCVAGLLENPCCDGKGQKGCIFSTYEELKNAVNAYNVDSEAGVEAFGIMDCWDISRITVTASLFNGFKTFNEKISCWDVSNVYSMNSMFQGALAFNQPLADWDVSNVLDMMEMFLWARSFNQPLASWNISNAKYMNSMFNGALEFNQNLCPWFDKSERPYGTHDSMFMNSACLHEHESEPDFTSKSHYCTDCV
jgi:surface protein